MKVLSIVFVLGFAIAQCVLGSEQGTDTGDLRYTFGEGETLPEGFEVPESMSKRSTGRPTYPACQDGSGGMCIAAGQCPADKKARAISGRQACNPGQECCYGGPINSRTPCADAGGECVTPPSRCGKGPQIRSGTECAANQNCCIWTF